MKEKNNVQIVRYDATRIAHHCMKHDCISLMWATRKLHTEHRTFLAIFRCVVTAEVLVCSSEISRDTPVRFFIFTRRTWWRLSPRPTGPSSILPKPAHIWCSSEKLIFPKPLEERMGRTEKKSKRTVQVASLYNLRNGWHLTGLFSSWYDVPSADVSHRIPRKCTCASHGHFECDGLVSRLL